MRTPVLEVTFSSLNDYRDRYRHVYVNVYVHDDENDTEEKQSVPTTAYGSDTPFHRVHFTNQTDREKLAATDPVHQIDRFYAVHVEWNTHHSDLDSLEEGVKALRKIDRYLATQERTAGRALSIGQYVLRLARAMKIRQVYVPDDGVANAYRDPEWAARVIDAEVNKWVQTEQGKGELKKVC